MKVISILTSLCVLKKAFSIFDGCSWSCVTSQHRSNSSTIKSMPSSCTNASSMTTSAAIRLSPLSCLKSHPSRRFFCNDDVACQSRRSRFRCRYVYASVGAVQTVVVAEPAVPRVTVLADERHRDLHAHEVAEDIERPDSLSRPNPLHWKSCASECHARVLGALLTSLA